MTLRPADAGAAFFVRAKLIMRIFCGLLILVFLAPAQAMVLHDESIDGDLPLSRPFDPTPIFDVTTGSNIVRGRVGSLNDGNDSFYLDLAGYQLDAIFLIEFPYYSNGWHLGLNVSYEDESGVASGKHFGIRTRFDMGHDLQALLRPTYGPGFDIPMRDDVYLVTLLSSTQGENFYGFDFQVSEVPVPPVLWLFSSGLLVLIGLGSRRAKINGRLYID